MAAVLQLKRKKIEFDDYGKCKWTPLHFVANYGLAMICRMLVCGERDLPLPHFKRRKVCHSGRQSDHSWVDPFDHLVRAGKHGNPLCMDLHGLTPLHIATKKGYPDIVTLLMEVGADVNSIEAVLQEMPLHFAAAGGHIEVVDVLLAANADTTATSKYIHNTPLMTAATYGHTDVFKLLLKTMKEVNAVGRHGQTTLHRAAAHCGEDILEVLLKAGADVNIRDLALGHTPLHVAAAEVNPAATQYLLTMNADPMISDNEGQT